MINFSRTRCVNAKKKLGGDGNIMSIWRKCFAPSNHVGNCTNLYRKLKPNSCEDFFRKYVEYAKENVGMPISQRGLSEEELFDLARHYKETCEGRGTSVDASVDDYLNDALCHIIVETWDGQHTEQEFVDFLENTLPQGYKCSKFEGSMDAKYGVDIKVTRSDGKVSAIQIKPVSFFMSNRPDVQKDRMKLCEKYVSTISDHSIKTYYAIYNQDKETGDVQWMVNTDGRFRFKVDDLFGFDPSNIQGTFVRKRLPETFAKLPV